MGGNARVTRPRRILLYDFQAKLLEFLCGGMFVERNAERGGVESRIFARKRERERANIILKP